MNPFTADVFDNHYPTSESRVPCDKPISTSQGYGGDDGDDGHDDDGHDDDGRDDDGDDDHPNGIHPNGDDFSDDDSDEIHRSHWQGPLYRALYYLANH